MRSDILSKYGDPHVLELRDICCSNVILTSKIKVSDGNIESFIRYSRYEDGSVFRKKLSKNSENFVDFKFKCTPIRPIFVSNDSQNSNYLHIHSLTSKEILERAENNSEMGVFNKNIQPQIMRNLQIRLREFMPIGIKSHIIEIE